MTRLVFLKAPLKSQLDHGRIDARKLRESQDSELDWVVMKALHRQTQSSPAPSVLGHMVRASADVRLLMPQTDD